MQGAQAGAAPRASDAPPGEPPAEHILRSLTNFLCIHWLDQSEVHVSRMFYFFHGGQNYVLARRGGPGHRGGQKRAPDAPAKQLDGSAARAEEGRAEDRSEDRDNGAEGGARASPRQERDSPAGPEDFVDSAGSGYLSRLTRGVCCALGICDYARDQTGCQLTAVGEGSETHGPRAPLGPAPPVYPTTLFSTERTKLCTRLVGCYNITLRCMLPVSDGALLRLLDLVTLIVFAPYAEPGSKRGIDWAPAKDERPPPPEGWRQRGTPALLNSLLSRFFGETAFQETLLSSQHPLLTPRDYITPVLAAASLLADMDDMFGARLGAVLVGGRVLLSSLGNVCTHYVMLLSAVGPRGPESGAAGHIPVLASVGCGCLTAQALQTPPEASAPLPVQSPARSADADVDVETDIPSVSLSAERGAWPGDDASTMGGAETSMPSASAGGSLANGCFCTTLAYVSAGRAVLWLALPEGKTLGATEAQLRAIQASLALISEKLRACPSAPALYGGADATEVSTASVDSILSAAFPMPGAADAAGTDLGGFFRGFKGVKNDVYLLGKDIWGVLGAQEGVEGFASGTVASDFRGAGYLSGFTRPMRGARGAGARSLVRPGAVEAFGVKLTRGSVREEAQGGQVSSLDARGHGALEQSWFHPTARRQLATVMYKSWGPGPSAGAAGAAGEDQPPVEVVVALPSATHCGDGRGTAIGAAWEEAARVSADYLQVSLGAV